MVAKRGQERERGGEVRADDVELPDVVETTVSSVASVAISVAGSGGRGGTRGRR